MKFFLVALAAVAASAVHAAECDTKTLGALLADPNLEQCGTDAGFDFTQGKKPTEAEAKAMCGSDACVTMLKTVVASNPTECTIPLGDKINLLSDLVYYAAGICGEDVPGATASSTAGSATASSTAGSTTSAPVDVGASTAGSDASSATVDTEVPISDDASSSGSTASGTGSVTVDGSSSGSNPASIATVSAAAVAVASVAAFML